MTLSGGSCGIADVPRNQRWATYALVTLGVLLIIGLCLQPPTSAKAATPGDPGFVSMTPARFADTRDGQPTVDGAGPRGLVGPDSTIEVPIAGRGLVPASGVDAVALNITATATTANTYITAYPTGQPRPTASNLNPAAGSTVPNMVIVKLGTNGTINLYNNRGTTHLIVDVLGWFPTTSDFSSMTPARFADTRDGQPTVDGAGPRGLVGPDSTIEVPIAGRGLVPASGVDAVALNITATATTANTYITAYPTGQPRPTASNLNPAAGSTVPNMVIVKLGTNGTINLYNNRGTTHLIVDVLGWFPTDQPAPTTPSEPTGLRAESHDRGLSLSWEAPDSDGGVPIVRYDISFDGGVTWIFQSEPSVRTVKVDGLVNARRYSLTVRAVNALGNGPASDQVTGVPAPHSQLTTGALHTCAIDAAGNTWCWGDNYYGQLGNGSDLDSALPVTVVGGHRFRSIHAGVFHTCAVDIKDRLFCWGENTFGQLGDGTNLSQQVPVQIPVPGPVVKVSAGYGHTCALLVGGQVVCWGDNSSGQLGDGSLEPSAVPTPVELGEPASDIASGYNHNCAVVEDSRLDCWGWNFAGQVGVEENNKVTTPTTVVGIPNPSKLTLGWSHTCTLGLDGEALCWGSNKRNQLAAPGLDSSAKPIPIKVPIDAVETFAGGYHSCAVNSVGAVACWGWNSNGQLGDGTSEVRTTPVATLLGEPAESVSPGGFHTCAQLATAEISCWGDNSQGQLGVGNGVPGLLPQTVPGILLREL